MKIYSKYNLPAEQLKPCWHSDLPSSTVPDQSLTIQELLERFTSGLLTPQSVWHVDISDDISDLDNPNPADAPNFDFTDRDNLIAAGIAAHQEVERLKQSAAAESSKRKKKEQATKERATDDDAQPDE